MPHPKETDDQTLIARSPLPDERAAAAAEARLEQSERELREFQEHLQQILKSAASPSLTRVASETDFDLGEAMQSLGNALRRLSHYVENTPLAVIEWDESQRVTSWSARAEALFGWTEAEAMAMEPADWRFTHAEDSPVARASLDQHADAVGQTYTVFQVRNHTKDGRILDCEWYNVVLTDPGGSTTIVSLVNDVTRRVQAEDRKNALLAQQTRIADTLQRSLLLPPPSPLLPGLEMATFYASALDEAYVGGDFYDALVLSRDRAAVVLGDLTGKGLQAAAYMAETKFALRAFLREHNDPGIALDLLNRFLVDSIRYDYEESRRTSFACLTVGIFDMKAGTLAIAAGGCEPPILLRARGGALAATELTVNGALLGTDATAEYEVTLWTLQPDDVLCLTTDGISEARRLRTEGSTSAEPYEYFGSAGVRRTAEAALLQDDSLDSMAEAVFEAARDFAGGELYDDVCLLAARWRP